MSNRVKRTPSTVPHPLEGLVLDAFDSSPAHDRVTIAVRLAGFSTSSRAYLVVAGDVLGYMLSQSKLEQDSMGWYYLTGTAPEGR